MEVRQVMRAYSVSRPVDIGTYPKDYEVADIVNFDTRRLVAEIGRDAWGYIDFFDRVPQEVLERFELVSPDYLPELPEDVLRVGRAIAGLLLRDEHERVKKATQKALEAGFDPEQLADAVRKAANEKKETKR